MLSRIVSTLTNSQDISTDRPCPQAWAEIEAWVEFYHLSPDESIQSETYGMLHDASSARRDHQRLTRDKLNSFAEKSHALLTHPH